MLNSLLLILMTGCVATISKKTDESLAAVSKAETTVIIYHVQTGFENELEAVLARTWEIYRREGLVFEEPHLILKSKEESKEDGYIKICFIEIFAWVGPFAVEHPSKSVEQAWEQMHSFCEPRNGKLSIEFRDVEVITPRNAKFINNSK